MPAKVSYYLRSDPPTPRNLAFEDSEWKAINQRVDTFYIVENVPTQIRHTLMPSLAPSEGSVERSWGYARADHLLELRHFIEKHPLTPTERIVAWAGTLLQKEARMMRLIEERERKKRRRTKEGGGERSRSPAAETPSQPVGTVEKAVQAPDQEPFVHFVPRRTVQGFSTDDLLRSSPVAQSKIVRSTSSKLNYILNEVRIPLLPISIQPRDFVPGTSAFKRRKVLDILELSTYVGNDCGCAKVGPCRRFTVQLANKACGTFPTDRDL